MFSPQPSMGIAWMARYHRESLFPLGKKARFQKVIRSFEASDSRQTHFLHQAVLEGLEQSLDAPFRLRTLCRDPFDPQFAKCPSELGARPPEGRFAHPLPQRLAAHRQSFLRQVFGSQRGSKISIPLAHPRQNLLLEACSELAIGGPSA